MKICLIAPYPELAALAREARAEAGLDFAIAVGNLEDALPAANAARADGAQVIVSRGGTAALLRQHLDIPVVEIKVTGYDVLRALYPYRGSDRTIGIVGFQNVVNGCRAVADILAIPIRELIIKTDESGVDWGRVKTRLRRMTAACDIDIVIGDTLVISKLKLDNLAVHLITSGSEAILQAVDEAAHIAAVRAEERKAAERFQTILSFVHDGVIATDEKGNITVFNPVAAATFRVDPQAAYGRPVGEVVANTRLDKVLASGVAELGELQQAPSGHIVTNRVPITVDGEVKGVVATFQEVSQLQHTEQKIRQNLYAKGFYAKYSFADIITADPRVQRLIAIAKNYARTDATVLIQGESGTGKELFAQGIHQAGPRAKGPFVAVNCSALPAQLLESELFGYVEGAFTGAKRGGKPGLFELAHNGTIFLDEIGDMDRGLQARLLRVIEERQVMRLGSDTLIPVNTRIVAATNIDLGKEVAEGRFRLDLYYRLNILSLTVPPLRERPGDIPLLAARFLADSTARHKRKQANLPAGALDLLAGYPWPGNVRELKSVIERIVLSAESGPADLSAVRPLLDELTDRRPDSGGTIVEAPAGSLHDIKRQIVAAVLREEGYNKSRAAKRLGVDRATIDRLL